MKSIVLIIGLCIGMSFGQEWKQTSIDSGGTITSSITLYGDQRLVGLTFSDGFEADTVTFQAYDHKSKVFKEMKYDNTLIAIPADTTSVLYFNATPFNGMVQFKIRMNTAAAPDTARATRYINYIIGKRK